MRDFIENVLQGIREEEGFSSTVYKCTEDHDTIGYGFKLDSGIPKEVAEFWLKFNIRNIIDELKKRTFWYCTINDVRRAVIIDMCYQMGVNGMLGFTKMVAAIEDMNFDLAANEMLNSKWARQTPSRAKRNADEMRSGKWA